MESGIKIIFVSKWFLIPVEYIDSKITIWPPDDISLIYSCWVTFINIVTCVHSKITMAGNVVPYYTVTALVPTLSNSAASLK